MLPLLLLLLFTFFLALDDIYSIRPNRYAHRQRKAIANSAVTPTIAATTIEDDDDGGGTHTNGKELCNNNRIVYVQFKWCRRCRRWDDLFCLLACHLSEHKRFHCVCVYQLESHAHAQRELSSSAYIHKMRCDRSANNGKRVLVLSDERIKT